MVPKLKHACWERVGTDVRILVEDPLEELVPGAAARVDHPHGFGAAAQALGRRAQRDQGAAEERERAGLRVRIALYE